MGVQGAPAPCRGVRGVSPRLLSPLSVQMCKTFEKP